MATVATCCVEHIGEVAGQVWHCLDENDQMSFSKLVKTTDQPRDMVMQAVGWLAREDKVEIEETARGRVIRLRELY